MKASINLQGIVSLKQLLTQISPSSLERNAYHLAFATSLTFGKAAKLHKKPTEATRPPPTHLPFNRGPPLFVFMVTLRCCKKVSKIPRGLPQSKGLLVPGIVQVQSYSKASL